jgi:hypothetical protein
MKGYVFPAVENKMGDLHFINSITNLDDRRLIERIGLHNVKGYQMS